MNDLDSIASECGMLIRAGYPMIYTYTWEEERLEFVCQNVAKSLKRGFKVWTLTEGFGESESVCDPLEMIRGLRNLESTLVLLKDFHTSLQDPEVIRSLRSSLQAFRKQKVSIIISSPQLEIPKELEKDIYLLDLPLPTSEEIRGIAQKLFDSFQWKVDPDSPQVLELYRAFLGLTANEIQRILARFYCSQAGKQQEEWQEAIDFIHKEKSQILRRMQFLEFFNHSTSLPTVGGMNQLKNWLEKRKLAFDEDARQFGLPEPKGIFLLGIQGCGKSLMAKATAGAWNLPLLRLDLSIFAAQAEGEGQYHLRDVLRIAESLSPVVLWVDEIEKAFSSMGGDSSLQRNFGSFITWMQEKTKPVFVVATANQVENLPPELLRKGRFDEIFFVDLPNIHERSEIFKIHFASRNQVLEPSDLTLLGQKTEGFSGAEIEQVIVDGMFSAFQAKRNLNIQDVLEAIEETFPLSVTMEEDIKDLKDWCRTRTRPATLDRKRIDYFEN